MLDGRPILFSPLGVVERVWRPSPDGPSRMAPVVKLREIHHLSYPKHGPSLSTNDLHAHVPERQGGLHRPPLSGMSFEGVDCVDNVPGFSNCRSGDLWADFGEGFKDLVLVEAIKRGIKVERAL